MKKLDKAMTERVVALQTQLNAMKHDLDDVLSDAEAYAEERSERWQDGEAGQAHEAWREAISEAMDAMEDASEKLDAILRSGD